MCVVHLENKESNSHQNQVTTGYFSVYISSIPKIIYDLTFYWITYSHQHLNASTSAGKPVIDVNREPI